MGKIDKVKYTTTGFYKQDLCIEKSVFKVEEKCVVLNKEDINKYTLIYIESGRFDVVIKGKTQKIGVGDIFLSRPYEKFEMIALVENSKYSYMRIEIHQNCLSEIEKQERILRIFDERAESESNIYRNDEIKEVAIYYQKIHDYQKRQMSLEFYKSLVILILEEICVVFDKKRQYLPAKFSEEYDLRIFSYILSRALTDIKIEDVIEKFYVSKWYVDKVCKKFYGGKSFSQLLLDCRMWAARGSMSNNMFSSLNKTAQLCGYTDYSGFYKAYKRFFGISPKEDLKYYKIHKDFYEKTQ